MMTASRRGPLPPPLDVLFEDNHCLVVNKPAGLVVHADEQGSATVFDAVIEYIRRKYHKPGRVYLGVVHRLDRNVSGALLFARTSKSASRLSEQIREHQMTKRYLALVSGRLPQPSGSIVQWLAKDRVTNQSRVVPEGTPDARRSALSWELVQSGVSRQLISILLESGRSHQIRVQLASLGCPILGDVKYGSRVRLPNHGLALHASELTFRHPVLPELVTVAAPPPTCWDSWLHEAVA